MDYSVYGVWDGGSSYVNGTAPEDMEVFDSITAAKTALLDRANLGHRFPQDFHFVNRDAESVLTPVAYDGRIWLYATPTSDEAFALLEIGPRGGVKRTNL
jgi:hypothetical protein